MMSEEQIGKGRTSKKSGGKKDLDKDAEDVLPGGEGGGASHSRDAGTQTDPQELQVNSIESDASESEVSRVSNIPHTSAKGQEQPMTNNSSIAEQLGKVETLEESEVPCALSDLEGLAVGEEKHEKVDPPQINFKSLRSFGRWADESEELDIRSNDTEVDSLAAIDEGSGKEGKELRRKSDQGFERPQELDVTGGATSSDLNENEFGGKIQQTVEVSPIEDFRASPRSKYMEPDVRGKSNRGHESPRSPHDSRADSWNSQKEDLRGKTQQSRERESLSQASREANWRRRPAEHRVRQDTNRSTGKVGLDGDSKKDDHQEFRSRSQYAAEPQATHKNWIPRRGLHSRGEGEGRAEHSKARGKGKQGREGEPQNEFSRDTARQKFEANLRIKQDELLQRSKQSLKEIQKAKLVEQVKKGGDQLEMELNKNLVYEDGELFYLNL